MKMNKVSISEEARRVFDGMEVVDAAQPLSLVVASADIDGAKRKDFAHCVFANTCRRQLASPVVAIMRTIAYVAHPGKDGVTRVYRYRLTKDMQKLVSDFDKGLPVRGGSLFTLEPVPPHAALDVQALAHQRSTARRAAYMLGELSNDDAATFEANCQRMRCAAQTRHKLKKGYSGRNGASEMDVRYGTGMISMQRQHA